ncbi:MAG: Asp-tRNA(Asn)/Glu-tRNA(Gln) amidotransferase subunit GatA [Deferribacterota bacterium]|nr:Asp-tRNA(Asn)/Glu-tRNA(Gln) amidotransferase subunit GatA [Deferribacterota bacterium]
MLDLLKANLIDIKEALDKKDISCEELVQFYLDRIKSIDEKLQSFITINDNALIEARQYDNIRRKKEGFPNFAGIPIAIKDNIVTDDMPTTCGSKILENYISPFNATVVKKLKKEGFIILGKLNLDEFAMGSSCENSYYKNTKNPWDLSRVPGGSSGGSAAATAARLTPVSIGSDTGGSIRLPASFCGIVGFKPTYGAISRYGLVAFASSLDQIGPLTTSVFDASILLSILSGHDPLDSTSAAIDPYDYTLTLDRDVKGMKIGLPKEYYSYIKNKDVEKAIDDSRKLLEGLGIQFKDISMPYIDYAIPAYYIIATAEASSNLARYDGVKYGYRSNGDSLQDMYIKTRSEGFGDEVKRRIMLGTYVLSAGYYDAYYLKAQKVRTLIRKDFAKAFEDVDILMTPTSPFTAFKLGEKLVDPLEMYQCDIFTNTLNLFGGCGISIPCGFDSSNLPIGLQFMGNYFNETKLLRIANVYQSHTDFHRRIPNI